MSINIEKFLIDLENDTIESLSKKYEEGKRYDFKEFPPLHPDLQKIPHPDWDTIKKNFFDS
jgi:hypothetical protein